MSRNQPLPSSRNDPQTLMAKRNDERVKGVIRSYLHDVREEYRFLAERLRRSMTTPPHDWDVKQLAFYSVAERVLNELIENRLQPSKHAPNDENQTETENRDAPIKSDPAGDSSQAS